MEIMLSFINQQGIKVDDVCDNDSSEISNSVVVYYGDGTSGKYRASDVNKEDDTTMLVSGLSSQLQRKTPSDFVNSCYAAAREQRQQITDGVVGEQGQTTIDVAGEQGQTTIDVTGEQEQTTIDVTGEDNSTTIASDNSREFLNSLIVFDYIVSAETPDRLCAICSHFLHAYDPVYALPCGHLFHVGCLRPWFRVKTTCPCPECKKEFN